MNFVTKFLSNLYRSINLSFISPKSIPDDSSVEIDNKRTDCSNLQLRKSQTDVEIPKTLNMTPSFSTALNIDDIKSSTIKLREDARARARLKSDEDLGRTFFYSAIEELILIMVYPFRSCTAISL